jgi:hypothetical protein
MGSSGTFQPSSHRLSEERELIGFPYQRANGTTPEFFDDFMLMLRMSKHAGSFCERLFTFDIKALMVLLSRGRGSKNRLTAGSPGHKPPAINLSG